MTTTPLTIFYDGYCPLCIIEINKLKGLDKEQNILFVDIQTPIFATQYPELDWHTLDARIHGYLADGRLISGLDVTYLAWKLVGKGWVYAPLRWPVIRWFADAVYLVFAKYRHPLSYLLTGKKRCVPCEAQPNQGKE
jgi:predicted DCC family thiol-disulfide oxidoreductase YuxK